MSYINKIENAFKVLPVLSAIVMLNTIGFTQIAFCHLDDYKPIGQSEMVATYLLTSTDDSLMPNEKTTDLCLLESGTTVSRFYSAAVTQFDTLCTRLTMKGQEAKNHPSLSAFVVDVYKFWKDEKMTVLRRFPGPIYKYHENLSLMSWQIESDEKEILGYKCSKASCRFRGRNWVAWYTTEIQLLDGPWKFCGLPGLILQVEDDKGYFKFSCVKISGEKRAIVICDDYFEDCTYEELKTTERNLYEDFYSYMHALYPEAQGTKVVKDEVTGIEKDAPITKNDKLKLPYNPLEL